MNFLLLDSWLREYLKTRATPNEIARYLSLSGPSVERLTNIEGDWVYDIEITTNRVDLMSVVGIAREGAAILPQFGIKAQFNNSVLNPKKPELNNNLSITIVDKNHTCRRIMAVILDNVNLKDSPKFITDRLKASGVRSLNNVVDITNYLMLELGQPTHVFDYDRIPSKKLILRRSKKGETITSFDNKQFVLPGEDIVIDNGKGELIDLPGIVGTANSVVVKETKRVLFFIDHPDPVQLRKTSMSLGIRTMAATINEKGVDPNLSKIALFRGISLFKQFANASVASTIYDIYPENHSKEKSIVLSLERLYKILGLEIDPSKAVAILNSLGFQSMLSNNLTEIKTTIPSFRSNDISYPEDLIEEIARIYGYHNLPSVLANGILPQRVSENERRYSTEHKLKQLLSGWGYTETYTYSMQSKQEIENANLSVKKHLRIVNPLSEEWVYMRRSIVPSLLSVVKNNYVFESKSKLFELANTYVPTLNNLPSEKMSLVIATAGENSFLKTKGVVSELGKRLNVSMLTFDIDNINKEKYFSDKLSISIKIGSKKIGILAEIKPEVSLNFGIKIPITFVELDFEEFYKHTSKVKTFNPIPLYPPIIEDYTFTFTNEIKIGYVINDIKKISLNISEILILDKFNNSFTFKIHYQSTKKQLTTEEIKPIRHTLVKLLKDKYEAEFKGKL